MKSIFPIPFQSSHCDLQFPHKGMPLIKSKQGWAADLISSQGRDTVTDGAPILFTYCPLLFFRDWSESSRGKETGKEEVGVGGVFNRNQEGGRWYRISCRVSQTQIPSNALHHASLCPWKPLLQPRSACRSPELMPLCVNYVSFGVI